MSEAYDVIVVLGYNPNGVPVWTTTVKGATKINVHEGHLILSDSTRTLAIFPAGQWKAVHRAGVAETR